VRFSSSSWLVAKGFTDRWSGQVGLGEGPNDDAKAHFEDRFARRLASSRRSASQSAFVKIKIGATGIETN